MKVYLVIDPYHDYAARIIEHVHKTYGYRALCVCTDRLRRACEAGAYPILRSKAVARHDEVPPDQIGAWAKRMAERYEIIGVVAHGEETVLPAAIVAEALQLDWNAPDVLRRFRDKYSLKEYLRSADPALRMNGSMRVSLHDFPDTLPYERFVLKPNDGVAGRNIGIFDARTPRAQIVDYLRAMEGSDVVMEEYVDGEEYFVNGQVDGNGDATVFGIFRYHRISANGQPRVMYRIDMVHRDDPAFDALERYAIQLLRASGLRRSPFHLEAKVDERGPCMIECGARLGGHATAFVCDDAHGGALDCFAVAAHDYLHDAPRRISLDWDFYEAIDIRWVDAIASGKTFVRGPEGIARAKSLRSFHRWAIKPRVGVSKQQTRDCLSMPYSAVLLAPRGADLEAEERVVRKAMERPTKGLLGLLVRAYSMVERAGHAAWWRAMWVNAAIAGKWYPSLVEHMRATRLRLVREMERPAPALIDAAAEAMPLPAPQPETL